MIMVAWRWRALGAVAGVFLGSLFACGSPPAPDAPKPAPTPAPTPTQTQTSPPGEAPLTVLPYTPSLDPSSLDRSVDPCDDLFHFACGGWMKANPIPADESSWTVYSKLSHDNKRLLWGLLTQVAEPNASRTPAQQKIGDYFASCMDEGAIEKAGIEPLREDLAAIAALKDKSELPALLGRMKFFVGAGAFFGFDADQDFENSTAYLPNLRAGGLGLPDRDQYSNQDPAAKALRDKYVAHVQRTLVLLGESPELAATHAAMIMRFETELAAASLTSTQKRDPHRIHHKMDIAALAKLTPGFSWTPFLAAAGIPNMRSFDVNEPEFFKVLDAHISSASLPDLQTYLRWHLAQNAAPYLDSRFVKEHFDFYDATLRGLKQPPPRWRKCVQWIDGDIGEALGQVYVEKAFSPAVKASTLDMVKRIEAAMEQRIGALDWMSPQTKAKAIEKLHGMRNKIGYPDTWRDYSALSIDRVSLYKNTKAASIFETRRQLTRIGKPVDRTEWWMSAPTVDAYYNAQMNDMNFPAGVLQPPLMDLRLDLAPSYGDTGGTVGHELTHGFDDEGRQYDARGNLKNWWSDADGKAFTQRAQCIVDQYAQVTVVDDIKLNSKLSLGEDVADLGGELLAYQAWKDATKGISLEPRDGLTPDQRFFVGFAQWVCGDSTAERKRLDALNNPHSPPQARINGVVVNMPEFATAFACKPGARMVKEKDKVCRVW